MSESHDFRIVEVADWKNNRFMVRMNNWVSQVDSAWFETEARRLQWFGGTRIGAGDAGAWVTKPKGQRLRWTVLLDPRTLGIATAADYGNMAFSFDDAVKRIDELPAAEKVIGLGDGRYRLEYYQPIPASPSVSYRSVYVLDSKRDFVVESHFSENVRGKVSSTVVDATYDWNFKDGHWLPAGLKHAGNQEMKNLAFTFSNWSFINVPIREDEIAIDLLDLPAGTTVYNEIEGSPFRKFVVDDKGEVPVSE
ncbi:hypothetical protein [Rubripirellula lacrimiformis]|uniref:hypothetical protein n=1 Tax=Rubripirellula lacrimiformis TaxID=1930273 RepID=UPI0011A58C10|nr:hypothetical protein [Rubripirellula lacrimiformis]